jgi:hypothetical protein
MNVFNQIFDDVVTPYLEPRIKKTSLQAVKGYIKSVELARLVAMGTYALGAASAIAVTGVILMIVAIIGLLPIDPRSALISILVVGAVLTIASAVVAYLGFRQKQWLELSKSREMMEAAMKPWPTAYSVPDPRMIFKAESRSSEPAAERSFERNREIRGAPIDRVPAPNAHEAMAERQPNATYPTLTTPDAAYATRTVDTTAALRPQPSL